MSILVFIQQENGKINRLSKEAIAGAQQLGEALAKPVSACVFNESSANDLTGFNLDKVTLVNNAQLRDYNPLTFASAMEQVVKSENPDLIIAGHTYEARDWIPRLSARLDLPFVSDCTGFKNEDGFKVIRSVFQGKISCDVILENDKGFISFQSGSYRADAVQSGSCSVSTLDVDLSQVSESVKPCLLYTSPSPRDGLLSRMPSSA